MRHLPQPLRRTSTGSEYAELVAVGVRHHDPADVALADVDSRRPERDEAIHLDQLIGVSWGSDFQMQPVLSGLRVDWRPAPGHLRTAARRLDRRLLILVPDQRPAQRLAPEVADLLRAIAIDRTDESRVCEEVVVRLDDAELIAFGIGEHHVIFVRRLTDVNVPAAQLERPSHGPL